MENTKQNKRVILPEDEEAAPQTRVVYNGGGRYYGNEEYARKMNATHEYCDRCGMIFKKDFPTSFRCKVCHRKNREERYRNKETKEWNEEPLFIMNDDVMFHGVEDLFDFCYENGTKPSDHLLLIGEAQYPRMVEEEDVLTDDIIPENCSYPEDLITDEVQEKMKELNEAIERNGVVSWVPSEYRPSDELLKRLDKDYQKDQS